MRDASEAATSTSGEVDKTAKGPTKLAVFAVKCFHDLVRGDFGADARD